MVIVRLHEALLIDKENLPSIKSKIDEYEKTLFEDSPEEKAIVNKIDSALQESESAKGEISE